MSQNNLSTIDVNDDLGVDVLPLASPCNVRLATNTKNELDNSHWPFDKNCKICGDRAIGYNFGIISCESCKAFFRRNACREIEITCAFTNACEINKISRKYCQSCRLQKCLKAGMKKEWLLGEKASRMKHYVKNKRHHSPSPTMEEIEKKAQESASKEVRLTQEMFQSLVKRARYGPEKSCDVRQKCTCICSCGFYPSNTRLVAEPSQQEQAVLKLLPNFTASAASAADVTASQPTIARLTAEPLQGFDAAAAASMNQSYANPVPAPRFPSNPYPGWYPQPPPVQETSYLQEYMSGMSSCLSGASQPGPSTAPSAFRRYENFIPPDPTKFMTQFNDYSFLEQANKQPFNAMPIPELSLFSSTIPPSLSAEDKALVQELINANYLLTMPMNFATKNEGELSLVDVVRISDLAMRRIITMAKKLHMFMTQMQSDQIAILKGSLSELLILRGVMVFDPTQDIWKHQVYTGSKEHKLTFDVLRKTPEQKHYAEHKKFLMSFDEKWRRNDNVMLILNAITLFCPDRPNIRDITRVQTCQRRYYDLLKRYLDTQCAETESRQAYDSLLRKLVDLHELNQSLLRIYSHVNPNDLDPLLKELFDVNPTGQ